MAGSGSRLGVGQGWGWVKARDGSRLGVGQGWEWVKAGGGSWLAVGQGWGWVMAGGRSRLGVGQGWGWVKAGRLKAEIMLNYTQLHESTQHTTEFLAGILMKGSVPFNGHMYKILKFIDLLDGRGIL